MKVKNREKAWEMADKLFPTDYVKRLVVDVKYDDFCSCGERVSQVGTQEKIFNV